MDIDVNNARTRVTEFLDSVSAAGKHDKSKLRVLIARKKNERAKKGTAKKTGMWCRAACFLLQKQTCL